jgi:hypothetical protein
MQGQTSYNPTRINLPWCLHNSNQPNLPSLGKPSLGKFAELCFTLLSKECRAVTRGLLRDPLPEDSYLAFDPPQGG